jgi:hypothetical protein
MINTKALYASTLVLAGMAGFSTGWTARPAEVRYASFEDRYLDDLLKHYRLSDEEVANLRSILADLAKEKEGLAREFDRKYHDQVDAVIAKYDVRIQGIVTPEKRR